MGLSQVAPHRPSPLGTPSLSAPEAGLHPRHPGDMHRGLPVPVSAATSAPPCVSRPGLLRERPHMQGAHTASRGPAGTESGKPHAP